MEEKNAGKNFLPEKSLVIYCASSNETVSVRSEDITLVNVFSQDNGMLINVVGTSFNIEALQTKIRSALEVHSDVVNAVNSEMGILEVDNLYIRDIDSLSSDEDESDEDDDNDQQW